MRLSQATLALAASTTAVSAFTWQAPWHPPPSPDDYLKPKPVIEEAKRVNVSLYVMSRCPDARRCEAVFEDVLKQDAITDKINLNIDFLGEIDNDAPYGVNCMHGDLECAGDAHQLCLHAHTNINQFYATLSCLNYGDFPGAIGTIGLTRRCADAVGIDWWKSGVGRCIEGKKAEREARHANRVAALYGGDGEVLPKLFTTADIDEDAEAQDLEHLGGQAQKRLRESVKRSDHAGVKKSCTIRIDSTIKHSYRECIVDGGVWKGCDDGHSASDFVSVIEKEYKNLE